jgi:uncharacterized protein
MTIVEAGLLFLAAMIGGGMNSVAGGGSFVSFPMLLAVGVPYTNANATNTVALWPGSVASVWAYRTELAQQPRLLLILFCIVSFVGGALGAWLLLQTSDEAFARIFPFLLLLATLLFAFGRQMTSRLRAAITKAKPPVWVLGLIVGTLQFIIAVYGGYFGGGIGIMMLAMLALIGMEKIHDMNAIKTFLATFINGIAVFIFAATGEIFWGHGVIMIAGAILGGYGGAYYAKKIDPILVRRFIIGLGAFLTVYYFVRTYIAGG